MQLQEATLKDFEPLLEQTFTLPNSTCELKLVSVTPAKHGQPGKRDPFTLLFRGPREPIFTQQLFTLENETLGRLDLFLVPVGQEDDGVLYEAVFN